MRVESMSAVSRRWMWMESVDVVVRRYIDFLIITYPYNNYYTPLVSVLFCSSIPTFCSFFLHSLIMTGDYQSIHYKQP